MRVRMAGMRGAVLAGAALAMALPGTAWAVDGYKFLESVKKGEIDEVKKTLAEAPGTINTHDISDGHTALQVVTGRDDAPWMNYLIAMHADVNAHDDKGTTALMIAAARGFGPGVQILLDNGARPDVADRTGETPLITAVHNRSLEIARLLLAGGADPARADNSGRSALDYARLMNNSAMLDVLQNTKSKRPKPSAATYGPH